MSRDQTEKRFTELQQRICDTPCPMERDSRALYKQLKTTLLTAWTRGYLLTPHHEVTALMKREESDGNILIEGGVVDFRRTSEKDQFRRKDGGLFNFGVTVREKPALELIAYRFELRLPQGSEPRFIRFDLNRPDHDNSEAGIRCHLHPGHDDLLVPSALLAPVEILELYLYHVYFPDGNKRKQRSK